MSTERRERTQVLQGTLDLIVLRTLAPGRPQRAYNMPGLVEVLLLDGC
jgi:hypothetical protein